MTLYGDNYTFDFYTWAHDIECANRLAAEVVARVIKKTTKALLKMENRALILRAFETNDFTNFPDSDSHMSIDTLEFNEIHPYADADANTKTNEIDNELKKKEKINCCSIL